MENVRSIDGMKQKFVEKYKFLLLDLDGTIVRSEDMHAQVGAKVISHHGVQMSTEERFGMKGLGEAKVWEKLKERGTPLKIEKADFISAHAKAYLDQLREVKNSSEIIRPWVVDLIDAFVDAGKKVGIVSNTTKQIVEVTLQSAGLSHKIDRVIAYDDMVAARLNRKPAPDGWISLLHHFGATNERSLLVGDNMADVLSGQATNDYLAEQLSLHGAAKKPIDIIQIYYDRLGETPDLAAKYAVADTAIDITNIFSKSATSRPTVIREAAARDLSPDVYATAYAAFT